MVPGYLWLIVQLRHWECPSSCSMAKLTQFSCIIFSTSAPRLYNISATLTFLTGKVN